MPFALKLLEFGMHAIIGQNGQTFGELRCTEAIAGHMGSLELSCAKQQPNRIRFFLDQIDIALFQFP